MGTKESKGLLSWCDLKRTSLFRHGVGRNMPQGHINGDFQIMHLTAVRDRSRINANGWSWLFAKSYSFSSYGSRTKVLSIAFDVLL